MKSRSVARSLICFVLLIGQFLLLPLSALALTIGEERNIGERLLFSVRRELPILDDPDISQYINTLGREVLETAGPQYFDYRFFIVHNDQFNAFAAPGGLVFFYTGLIETMRSEDELVSVLAHEIGHVDSRHIAQRLEKGGKVGAASLILAIAGLAIGVPGLSQGLLAGSLAAGQAVKLQYSRTDEEEADRLAFEWMRQMRRDPAAMEDMLRTMRRITRYRVGADTPQYLLTHPNPEARLSYVQSLLELDEKRHQEGYYLQTDNFAFLRFKYRVLMQVMDHARLRQHCAFTLANSKDREQQALAQYGLALLEGANRNVDQALRHLAKVREQYPNKDILEIDRAVLLLNAGRVEEARRLLEWAYRRDPTDMYGVYHLARVEQMRGNLIRAEQLLQEMTRVMPEYAQLYFDLGRIEADRGRMSVSHFYLGKYNFYLGREKVAEQYMLRASKDESVPEKLRAEALDILEKLKELSGGR
ncbi:beta-barrel assembly-enhancing protease [Desulfobulbus alkaliphilus]|uniref:beta-barrel assembly-enhancing protease n=1 Tax=Desulfobulbus alkaliphilus TaxID=869814 RepID=UPI001962F9FD|nr:M48 family metallopeptidase [Desulfobulbus alkaliphilus]MBM9536532.1 M48 family metalloprotease [Desulfobulbus alkaliphilus]